MKLNVQIKSTDRILLSVELDGNVLSGTFFEYYRSNKPRGGFVSISEKTQSPYWVDNTIDLRDDIPYYYKVRIYGRSGKKFTAVETINPMDVEPEVIELARQYVNQLYNYPGQGHNYLLYTKTIGQKNCPYCYDEILQKRIREKCDYCNGSGKMGGYIGPYALKIGIITSSYQNVDMEDSDINQNLKKIWVGNFPLISRGDIFVCPNKYRWKVIDITPKAPGSFLVRQDVIIAMLLKHDAEYSIPDKLPDKKIVWTNERAIAI